jgi:hypothetical protein
MTRLLSFSYAPSMCDPVWMIEMTEKEGIKSERGKKQK